MDALQAAVDHFGTRAGLARAIGVTPQTVTNWFARGYVPEDQCPAIELATGIRCERLNDRVEWVRNRRGLVTHYKVQVRLAA